jgi:hypothetical protein
MSKPVAMVDMYKLSEEDRIGLIGKMAMHNGHATFTVDHDDVEKGKADRYARKLRERFPRLREKSREEHAPVKNCTTVHVVLTDD